MIIFTYNRWMSLSFSKDQKHKSFETNLRKSGLCGKKMRKKFFLLYLSLFTFRMNLISFLKFWDPTEADESTRKTKSTALRARSLLTRVFNTLPNKSTFVLRPVTFPNSLVKAVMDWASLRNAPWVPAKNVVQIVNSLTKKSVILIFFQTRWKSLSFFNQKFFQSSHLLLVLALKQNECIFYN